MIVAAVAVPHGNILTVAKVSDLIDTYDVREGVTFLARVSIAMDKNHKIRITKTHEGHLGKNERKAVRHLLTARILTAAK